MDREDWSPFLHRWSEEWIHDHDPERDQPLPAGAVEHGWLGFPPASTDEIAAAEHRLGRSLPPSFVRFLQVSNGWWDAGPFIYRVAGTRELDWLRDVDGETCWIEAYSGFSEADDGDILARSLRISLDGDASVLVLDPGEVDENGEWAAYSLASWSGMGPEHHDSFYDLMHSLYASFHSLRKPEGDTRDGWDAKVTDASLASLAGEIDGPLAILAEAAEFGRYRATLLRFQILAMLNNWHTVLLSHVVLFPDDMAVLLRDPLFTAELLPLLLAEGRLTHSDGRFTLEQLISSGQAPAELLARLRDPGRLTFGNPEFDTAVRRVLDLLTVDPERAWPELKAAIGLWRPLTRDHLAPVVLFADPLLAKLITPERGREILSMRRGDQR